MMIHMSQVWEIVNVHNDLIIVGGGVNAQLAVH